jgi:hypothetical protein
MLDIADGPGADDHFGLVIQYRRDEFFDVRRPILIVGVSIDNNIGAVCYAGVEARHECPCQTLVVHVTDNVMHAMRIGCFYGIVRAAVIDYEPFDFVEARHGCWQLGQRDR